MFSNPNRIKFIDLSEEEQLLIIREKARGNVEHQSMIGWVTSTDHAVDFSVVYRVKASKPSINWDHVSKKYKYLAMDKDGMGFLYTSPPNKRTGYWETTEGFYVHATVFESFNPGNCHWEESLVERPE